MAVACQGSQTSKISEKPSRLTNKTVPAANESVHGSRTEADGWVPGCGGPVTLVVRTLNA